VSTITSKDFVSSHLPVTCARHSGQYLYLSIMVTYPQINKTNIIINTDLDIAHPREVFRLPFLIKVKSGNQKSPL